VPNAEWLFGVAQQQAALVARRASPEAFVERMASRTAFEHLVAAGAARVARQAFPTLIEKHDGGVPTLPAGEKLRRFSEENVAQISLPDHERGVIESIEPMAIRTASGQFQPINLALKNTGASFTPIASQVAVQISKHLGGGVRAPQSGVSLTPIAGKGKALHGPEGSIDGASVLYTNTQTDTDTLGSGVATQGGASYVPQVARGLQTAPIIPPGAFPNGSSGTQFTAAPVTTGAIAGAQEIATQFWQKAEAERQKAREQEAEEKAGMGAAKKVRR
jgi:hypothetical protein